MSVSRLDAKCVDVIGRNYARYSPERLEEVVRAPAAWDALWESAVHSGLLSLAPSSSATSASAPYDDGEVDPRPLLRHRLRERPPPGDGDGRVLELDLTGVGQVLPKLAAHIVDVCPDLTHIKVVSVGDEGLRVLADGLPALRGLAIESAIFLTDSGTRYLFEGDASIAARLRSLHLNRNVKIGKPTLKRVVEACTQLRELTLTHFAEKMDSDLVLTIARAPLSATLTSLWINDCEGVTDDAMSEIIDRCISLEELRIGMGIDITGDCFLRLSSHNAGSRLRRLDFNNCPLPRATFHHIASVCTNLQTLGLANSPTPLDKEQLSFLLQQCPRLSSLSTTVAASDALTCFEQENRLRYLYLQAFTVTDVAATEGIFEDDHIKCLVTGSIHLENLTLNKVRDDAFSIIVSNLPSLRSLSLTMDKKRKNGTWDGNTYASCASEADVNAENEEDRGSDPPDAAPVSKDLSYLRLFRSNINAKQVHWLVSHLSSLEDDERGIAEIQFSGCLNINGEAIESISLHCASTLRKLSVYGSSQITDQSLEALTRCYRLRQLSLKMCSGFSPTALARLVRARRATLRQIVFPQGPSFRREAKSLLQECPYLRIGTALSE